MSEKEQDINNNPFLMRGCEKEPLNEENIESFYKHGCCKLDTYNWMRNLTVSDVNPPPEYVEVRFKNDRKAFFKKTQDLRLSEGDLVAVESSPGHDIGIVTLLGEMAHRQYILKKSLSSKMEEVKKVYRKARNTDVDKWKEAVKREEEVKFQTRRIVNDLKLEMKINDVELQGDGTKAIFYYTADDRVDFRELIKRLADQFKLRIEMKQIGARQEAGKLGGIGSCGRELCCASWMTDFSSVTTAIARAQQLSLNPQKLAGQCGKLKCCLNYEYDNYVDALKSFPKQNIELETKAGNAFFQKANVFERIMWYSYKDKPYQLIGIRVDDVDKIQKMNLKKQKPDKLESFAVVEEKQAGFEDQSNEEELKHFDD